MTIKQFNLLDTKRFFPLFLTQFLGAFNDNIYKNALVILITYKLADQLRVNPGILITVAAGVFILPFFLFSATAGQLADKFEKSMLIRYTKMAEIILALIAGAGFYLHSIGLLIFVLFLLGTQATFFGPMKYSILPDHLKENELIAGNALLESSTFLAILLGTIAGGVLASIPLGMFIVPVAVLLVAFAGYYTSLSIPKSNIAAPTIRINLNFIQETWAIVQHTFENENLYVAIMGISWFWLMGATYISQFPTYVKSTLGAESSVVTLLLMFFSTGIAVGSLLCNRLLRGKIHATYVPLAALGMTIFAIDLVIASKHAEVGVGELVTFWQFTSHLANWHILIDLFLFATCGGIYIVPLYALLQHESEEAYRSRVIACNNIMNALFMVVSSIAVSIMLFIHLSITKVFIIVALANLFAAIYICRLLPEQLVKSLLIWLVKTCYRAEVIGIENYNAAGNRVLIVSNHTSFLDALLLAALLPDRLSFAINTHVAKKWWIKLMLKLVNTYQIDPSNPLATKSLIEYLSLNHRVVIFPEGRITVTGALMKIYEGPGLIADKADAFLLPIRIDGAQYTPFSRLRGKVKLRWFPKITLTILPPKKFDIPKSITGRERRQLISIQLYDLMSDAVFASSNLHETLFQSIINAKLIHGGRHLILEDIDREPMNYNRLIARSLILSRAISKKTRRGEYVGVMLPNSIANAVTFFAMQAIHRVPAMINFSAGIHNIVSACQLANIRCIYTSKRFVQHADLSAVVEVLLAEGIKFIYLEDVRTRIGVFSKLIGLLASKFPDRYYSYLNGVNDENQEAMSQLPAVLLFTSGSEGTPKGVVLSHHNLQSNRFQITSRVDFNPSDRVFNALPMFHSFGLNSATLLPVISGMYLFLYPSPLHYKVVPELCYDVNASIFFGTDTFLNNYAKYAHPYNFYCVRYVFAGAEKLRDETRQHWMEKFGIRIMEGYGVTEASPAIAVNTTMQYKYGSVGRLLPGMRYRLEPVEGIHDGGRFFVAGPNIMLGYFLSSAPCVLVPPVNNWHDTGDVVAVDDEGFLSIKGRVKRFAKIAGEMVSLAAVEETLNALWPKYKNAVIAQPDDRKGEQLVFFTDNPKAEQSEIIAYFRDRGLAEIYIPRKITILATMPLLGSGKIDYMTLKSMVVVMSGNQQLNPI